MPLTEQQVLDPLLVRVPLNHRRRFFARGLPIVVSSNSRAVLDAAEISWGGCAQLADEKPIDLRCIVQEGGKPADVRAPSMRAQANLLVSVFDDSNFAAADLSAGIASAWVTDATVADTETFRYQFLEAMAYTLLDVLHVVAVHAACVQRNGKGVLLAGESGAGKSSLAYACARRGWIYVSDDTTSLLRRSQTRIVIGTPERFRFRVSAGDLFPEFKGMAETKRANRKPTIEVLTESMPAISTALESPVDFILLLNRRTGALERSSLVPIRKQQAFDQLFNPVWPDQLPANEERRHAIERLLSAEAYEMRYRTLAEAITLLERLTGSEDEE